MSSLSRSLSLGSLALAASLALSGCIVVPAGHYGGRAVMVAPPQPQPEVVVAAPGPGFFWIPGFWNWYGDRHVWVGGHWEAHRPGYQWAPHHWEREGQGWRDHPGHWEQRR
jgi:hypothetical protein